MSVRHLLRLLALPTALVAGDGCTGHRMPIDTATPSTAAALIRAARERSNDAIARHDTAAIASEWMPDVHVVASTGTQTAGATLNAQRMAQQFERRSDTRYVRTPDAIEVFEAWDVASERGHWVGTWTDPDGPIRIGGTYQAQWRRVDGRWRIQAEVFVPLTCAGGAYCAKHP
jgi:ketosteroid isomerase-like protein